MYELQQIDHYDAPPSRRRRKKRRSPLPFWVAALILGIFLGWTLRGYAGELPPDNLGRPDEPFIAPAVPQTSSSAPDGALLTPPDCPDWIEQDFLSPNPYSRPGTRLEGVNGIVVHYVGNPGTTARQNHSYFQKLADTHETYASSHFLIGLEGEILQNVPLDEIAYCSSHRNSDTISIECCHPGEDGAFTQETYDALVKLVSWLQAYYGLDTSQIIRHYNVTGKECPLYYVRNPEEWENFLTDLAQ